MTFYNQLSRAFGYSGTLFNRPPAGTLLLRRLHLHHIQHGCSERFNLIDFLCGGFSWKQKFHLTERPLYLLSNCSLETHPSEELELRVVGHVE